jgi:hypothetical protein
MLGTLSRAILSVFCVGGLQYYEYVIYRGEQAYPEFLVTYKLMV